MQHGGRAEALLPATALETADKSAVSNFYKVMQPSTASDVGIVIHMNMTCEHRGTGNGGGITRIGSHNLVMGNVHIAHDCIIGNHCIFANNAMLAGHVHVDDYANIGGGAGLHHFVKVGYCGFVGGMARVSKDVPPFMLAEGSPAAIRGYNHVAMSRIGMDEMELEAVKEAYKKIYRLRGGAGVTKIASLLRDFPTSKALRRIAESIRAVNEGLNGRSLEVKRTDDKRAVRVVRG